MTASTKTSPRAVTAFNPATTGVEEVLAASREVASKRTRSEPAKNVAEITGNPFHKIMFDPALSLEEKRQTMAKGLVYDKALSEEKNAERLRDFVAFSEWLQTKRKELAIDMLKLNDAEAFAQLKEVIDELGAGIIDFNKKIEPFLTILDSLYQMQLKGVRTSDMLGEIIKDREELDRLNSEMSGYNQSVDESGKRISSYRDRIAELKTETSWWTLGTKLKASAQADINKFELRIEDETKALADLAAKVEETKAKLEAPRATQFEGLESVKDNLRMLLDITSDEHRDRQRSLNEAAADFVTSSDKKVAGVLTNIQAMNGRIEAAGKNSSKVLGLYAVMNDAVGSAMSDNHGVLGSLSPVEGVEEGLVAQMQREETREATLRHIKTLTGIKEDTVKMYDGLSKEKAELVGMLDSNNQQIATTRYLHGSGIANMGMQLNAMITALSSAANGQSTKVAQELVDEMGANAVMIRGKDSLRAALDFQGTNETLERTIQLAAQSAELMRNASDVTGDALSKQQELLERVKAGADDMQRAITEGLEVYAASTDQDVSNDNARCKSTPSDGSLDFDLNK